MLRCRNCSRHGIYHRAHLLEHGTARTLYWPQASRRHGHDHVETDALPVRDRLHLGSLRLLMPSYSYQGHIGAALVLGGVDVTGPQLFTIHPHGSTDKLPYVTMGSGSLAAMAVFEARWQPNMEVRVPIPYGHVTFSPNSFSHYSAQMPSTWSAPPSPPVSSTISAPAQTSTSA